ncbi:expressed unknown protein [Seminavis robusta]|uniref:Uncharacterized protein n=1 Tax=Seminavis robusta TaxID=568900 RepID=A0A9N8H7G7_9STRA|nr:expressed unknown protein [Seminavis robusta]|eukprot:Sro140_g065460.1 n/a (136) ;mRNA; r:46470-46877
MKFPACIAKRVMGAKSLPPKKEDKSRKSKARGDHLKSCDALPYMDNSGDFSVRDPVTELQIATAEVFYACLNDHDLKGANAVVAVDATFVFRALDGSVVHEMRWQDFQEEVQKLFDSFPDFWFKHKSIKSERMGP